MGEPGELVAGTGAQQTVEPSAIRRRVHHSRLQPESDEPVSGRQAVHRRKAVASRKTVF